jgi:uncharacterized protein (DUF433 family)
VPHPDVDREEALISRITRNPRVLAGRPVIRGLRISFEQLQKARAAGIAEEELLDDYPELEPEDFLAINVYERRKRAP